MAEQRSMGFDFGLEKDDVCIKRKNHWLFKIKDLSADGVNALPPFKSARPTLSFKTMEIIHLNENIYRPARPDWKPISLVLFDIKQSQHPVFQWLKNLYDPQNDAQWIAPSSNSSPSVISDFIMSEATLELYDGGGYTLETWNFENVWPESIDFTDLDMAQSEICYVNLSLRYDRAYLDES